MEELVQGSKQNAAQGTGWRMKTILTLVLFT